jgi:RHS repeat-associated protein
MAAELSIQHFRDAGAKRFDHFFNNVHDITVVQRDSGLGDGYRYDLTQEITDYYQDGTVTNGVLSSPARTNNMLFDGCGNRTSLNGVTQTFDNMNQPTGVTFSHDSKGNLCTNGGSSYTYDAQNRLTHVVVAGKSGNTTVDFYYDAKNRQIARASSINGAVTFSVWDDWELVEEYTNGNIRTAAYLQGAHGPTKSLIPNNYFYQDSLGSTSHLASSAGALLEYYKYDLNGKPTYWNAGGTQIPATLFAVVDLFAGERYISEVGLYDDRNRFYSPDMARFLQPDPIGFKGDASNLYRYCGNDWANRTDPMGLDPEIWLIRDSAPGYAPGSDQARRQPGQYFVKDNGKVVQSWRANKNGPQEFLPMRKDPNKQSMGVAAGDYKLLPKAVAGDYPIGQPAITGLGPGLKPGQADRSYPEGSALVHGEGRSRACVTVPDEAVEKTTELMGKKGIPMHIRDGGPNRAQPVKPKSSETGGAGQPSASAHEELSPGQQQIAKGNYGAWNTNATGGAQSFGSPFADTAGASTFLKAAGF